MRYRLGIVWSAACGVSLAVHGLFLFALCNKVSAVVNEIPNPPVDVDPAPGSGDSHVEGGLEVGLVDPLPEPAPLPSPVTPNDTLASKASGSATVRRGRGRREYIDARAAEDPFNDGAVGYLDASPDSSEAVINCLPSVDFRMPDTKLENRGGKGYVGAMVYVKAYSHGFQVMHIDLAVNGDLEVNAGRRRELCAVFKSVVEHELRGMEFFCPCFTFQIDFDYDINVIPSNIQESTDCGRVDADGDGEFRCE